MDGLPPSPPAETRPAPAVTPSAPAVSAAPAVPAAPTGHYVYAATDIRARDEGEGRLCDKAGSVDWLYMGGAVVLNVAAGYFDPQFASDKNPVTVRMLGPLTVGASFGFAVGGSYLALPHCSRDWIHGGTPEGEVHQVWPLTVSLALLAAIVAPVVQAVEIGGDSNNWSDVERSSRVVVTGAAAFGAAFLPYLLPPSTWRAAKELDKLRFRYDTGARAPVLGYGVTF